MRKNFERAKRSFAGRVVAASLAVGGLGGCAPMQTAIFRLHGGGFNGDYECPVEADGGPFLPFCQRVFRIDSKRLTNIYER